MMLRGLCVVERRASLVSFAIVLAAALVTLVGCGKGGVRVSHELYDQVLKRHVEDGLVDYKALADDETLTEYLDDVANADLSFYTTREESMAFWINAYNATVLHAVAVRYPVRSIAMSAGFFDGVEHQVEGRAMTLNDMGNEMWVRFRDPRVHFVLSLAAVGGPTLARDAFLADGLDARLEEAARRSIIDDGMAILDREEARLDLSAIFSWFGEEFSQVAGSVDSFVSPYLSVEDQAFVSEHDVTVSYMLYDWALNVRPEEE
ncbi:hypothetical protein AMJ71_02690 [candidate division TA06 bacterium SM1_40]|uniref:DUF547 domain-containing protein n=1 Tax=candidate division TA06 bacterium SM1_40 TaxID=1703773 RepID=A0A0S8JLR2_UNCT6|nr:MAG: hypothetical protein AMJ71_02690 [candidate division TA06 bacterium SM1_40]